jgi:nitroreductase
MQRMREAIRSAPSACNYQPWHFILVEDGTIRRQLAAASKHQLWMADAPVTVVACGFPDRAYKNMGGSGNSVEIDVAIALDHLTLAAVADGLGTCWIGAFSESKVKKLLGIPRDVKVVAMTPLGYPSSPHLNHPLRTGQRKSEDEVFSVDRYGGASPTR